MNIEQTKKAIKVMQAFVDGGKIHHRRYDQGVPCPTWNWEGNTDNYSIAPEPIVGWAVVREDGNINNIFNVEANASFQADTASDWRVVKLVEEE